MKNDLKQFYIINDNTLVEEKFLYNKKIKKKQVC